MIRINQIKLDVKDEINENEHLKRIAKKKLNLKNDSFDCIIRKKSIDARRGELKYIYCVDVIVHNMSPSQEDKLINRIKDNNIIKSTYKEYDFIPSGTKKAQNRPVVIGFGPAGMFCALMLAKAGFKPLVLEQGASIEERVEKVEKFFAGGELDVRSNVQFGEGGAGTFSDGKLNTLVKDAYGRGSLVLETFAKHGAPKEITYINKPHIGTDLLRNVVVSIRKEIEQLGGEILFNTKVTDIEYENQRLTKLICSDKIVECSIAVMAIGHSSRDTFRMLSQKSINMTAKPFAIGVRIEHPQKMIDRWQYNEMEENMPAASYKLTHKASNGRGVYTFCMCPGGFVVNASSQKEMIAVNGMSNYKRDEVNANSAIIVTVDENDFGSNNPLAGVIFQEKWERAAYREGEGAVPVQLFSDFKNNVSSKRLGQITPSVKGGYKLSNINNCLPEYVCESIVEGIEAFDKKIKGFADGDSVLSAVETRTSSPVRIHRDENTFTCDIQGLYPCGEGAGYAGGIMSAAIDGIKVYEAIAKEYCI